MRQYKDFLNHKKNEFVDSRLLELENPVVDSDKTKLLLDDTIKETSVPLRVTEVNWMSQSQLLRSNEPRNSYQEMITNQLRNLEQELYKLMSSTIE